MQLFAYLSALAALFWANTGDLVISVWDAWKLLPLTLVSFFGVVLLVCNHRHYIDPVVILAALKTRAIGFVAKKEIRRVPIVGKLL